MSETQQPKSGTTTGDTFSMGDIGMGARVAQGKNITWTEGALAQTPGGQPLVRQFQELLQRIEQANDMDEDTRMLVTAKTEAVANGLANAQNDPGKLRMALIESKAVLGSVAGWTWKALSDVLKSEAAQKTIATITEASTKAAIGSIIGS